MLPGTALAGPSRGADVATRSATGNVATRSASQCRPRKYEKTVASSSQIVVLYYDHESRADEMVTERRVACSRRTGRRVTVWSRTYDDLDQSANSAGGFQAAGTYVAWLTVTGDRFGPYYPTVHVRQFGASRARSFDVPVPYGEDTTQVRSLRVSASGEVAFTTRSRRYGDVLRVLDTGGVARRNDQGDMRSIGSLTFAADGTLSWRHAGVLQRRAVGGGDPCLTALPGPVDDATADAIVTSDSHTGIRYGCLRATGRVVRLAGAVPDTGEQGSTALAGRYVATVRHPTPLRSVVDIADLQTGRVTGPSFPLAYQVYGQGPIRPSLQLLPDGRLVALADNDGKHPLVVRDPDGTVHVLDAHEGIFNAILDDGLVLYQTDGNPPTLAGRTRIAPSALHPAAG